MSLAIELANIDLICEKIKADTRGYCPHKPHGKQKYFLSLPDMEALYGGSAGGGKSDALLMEALKDVDQPGYSALLLRRTFRDLNQPKAIMHRCHSWLRGSDAIWNARDKRYTFPKSGATLTFGYFDSERDKDQYASAEFHFIGWDELTQFPEGWYTWMFSRLRREASSKIKTRVRAATNPGGIGHSWVRKRFIDVETAVAPFVPASLKDNPFVDVDSYREALSKLDKVTRDQLEEGVWRNDASGLVYHSFIKGVNTIQHAPHCQYYFLGLDFGLTRDSCSWNVLGWNIGSPLVYIVKSYKKDNVIASEAAEESFRLNEQYHFEGMVGDANGIGTVYVQEARRRYNLPVEPTMKSDKIGIIKLFNGELENRNIVVVEPECKELLKEWEELPWADEGRAKEAEGFDNHCSDGTLYAWRKCRAWQANHVMQNTGHMKSSFTRY